MAENAEAERHVSQAMLAAVSVALGIGIQVQQHRLQRARAAQMESEERQREIAAQLAAERETAAVLWRRLEDRQWMRDRPDEVAQAWASARAWESLDPRAAEARAKFDLILGAMYDDGNTIARMARDTANYEVLATLLQRAVDYDPDHVDHRYYEEVPPEERREWLERAVWGPESDENERIARSAEMADLDAGLPVAVLRQMDEDTRTAWLELERMSPQERYMWRRRWLEGQVWGPENADKPEVLEQRSQALQELIATNPSTPAEFSTVEWHAFVAEVRERVQAAGSSADGSTKAETASVEAVRERDQGDTAAAPAAKAPETPRESEADRLERTRIAVRECWPEEVATPVIDSEAFGAFAHRLHQLEERGYPMEDILGRITPHNLIGVDRLGRPVRDSAAFAEYFAEKLVEGLPPRVEAEAGIERLEQYVAENSAPQDDAPTAAAGGSDTKEQRGAGSAPSAQAPAPRSAPEVPQPAAARVPAEDADLRRYEKAVEAVQQIWPQDADWIVASQTRSVEKLADALGVVAEKGHDPAAFMREAIVASGVKRLHQPNSAVGEAAPTEDENRYPAGITHPGTLGTDPAKFAARMVEKRWLNLPESEKDRPRAESDAAEEAVEARDRAVLAREDGRFGDAASPTGGEVAADQVHGVPSSEWERRVAEPATAAVPAADIPARPVSPWSRAAGEAGLGGDLRDAAAREDALAMTDHRLAGQRRDDRVLVEADGDAGDSASGDPAEGADEARAAGLGAEAERLDSAAGEHEAEAVDLRARGAYDNGADTAQLAGQAYPTSVPQSLGSKPAAGRSNRQGAAAPQARRWRGQEPYRGR
jgi:hypothetical protein